MFSVVQLEKCCSSVKLVFTRRTLETDKWISMISLILLAEESGDNLKTTKWTGELYLFTNLILYPWQAAIYMGFIFGGGTLPGTPGTLPVC